MFHVDEFKVKVCMYGMTRQLKSIYQDSEEGGEGTYPPVKGLQCSLIPVVVGRMEC
jgi:hypothetical protein